MRTYERTKTDIEVQLIDSTVIEERLTDFYRKGGDDRATSVIKIGHKPYGFVETKGGTFVLCNEGVGSYALLDAETYRFDGYAHTPTENGETFTIVPVVAEVLTVTEIKELATGETENLATFIRTFGDRLDRNYENYRREIEEAS